MRRHRQDLARFDIMKKQHARVLLPSHFDPIFFTVTAFNNFNHLDKNSLSGMEGTHDTAIRLFQIKVEPIPRPKKSEIKLHDLAKVHKLPCQEIITFTTNKILKVPEQFSPSTDLFYSIKRKKLLKKNSQ